MLNFVRLFEWQNWLRWQLGIHKEIFFPQDYTDNQLKHTQEQQKERTQKFKGTNQTFATSTSANLDCRESRRLFNGFKLVLYSFNLHITIKHWGRYTIKTLHRFNKIFLYAVIHYFVTSNDEYTLEVNHKSNIKRIVICLQLSFTVTRNIQYQIFRWFYLLMLNGSPFIIKR